MRYTRLDKTISTGTTYTSPARTAYKVEEIGCDVGYATGDTYLTIDRSDTGQICQEVASLYKQNTQEQGLLDLEDYFYYIPTETDWSVSSDGSPTVRIRGKTLELEPGESEPDDLMTRFNAQHRRYIRYNTDTQDVATGGGNWADGNEQSVLSISPNTNETLTFNNYFQVDLSGTGFTWSAGDMGVNVYIDNNPIEPVNATNLDAGIDGYYYRSPPTDSTTEMPRELSEFPIEVEGDHTIDFRVENVSGGALSPTSGALTARIVTVYEYEKVE